MSVMDAVFSVFSQYAEFSGRARRAEYWQFFLFNSVAALILGRLSFVSGIFALLSSIYSLVIFIPGLAVAVRRMHDIGKSGWALCVNFIPLVGSIIYLVWCCSEGMKGPNNYGPDPKK